MNLKSHYSFQDHGTDRQTESISECTLKDLSNDMTRLSKLFKAKIRQQRGKQYNFLITLEGRCNKLPPLKDILR